MAIAVPSQFSPLLTPISDIKTDPKNARKHDERNLQAIKDSLTSFGWRSVIVASKETKVVLSGNGRLEAARQLKEKKVPVLFVNANDEQAAAYAISDNRTAELAGWDDDMLAAVLSDLQGTDYDLGSIGFDEAEMDALLANVTAEVDAPGLEDPPERDTSNLPENKVKEENPNEHLVAEKMPSSSVRLIQLFFDDTNVEEFNLAVRRLAAQHKTENITDTVRKTVLDAAAALK